MITISNSAIENINSAIENFESIKVKAVVILSDEKIKSSKLKDRNSVCSQSGEQFVIASRTYDSNP